MTLLLISAYFHFATSKMEATFLQE